MTTQTKSKKVRKLVSAHVEADAEGLIWGRIPSDPETLAKELRKACKEFSDFIKDHRSMDAIRLDVVEEWNDVCSECGHPWEVMDDECGPTCAWCGVEVDQ